MDRHVIRVEPNTNILDEFEKFIFSKGESRIKKCYYKLSIYFRINNPTFFVCTMNVGLLCIINSETVPYEDLLYLLFLV